MVQRFFFGHDLKIHRPARKIALSDGIVQIPAMAFPVLANQRLGLFIRQVLNALLGQHMELAPHAVVVFVIKAKGMAAEAVHMAIAGRNSFIAHNDCNLVHGFRQNSPKIPVILRVAQVGFRIAFYCSV